jgi:putative SOS response-associated peptidase YedK
MCGRYTLAKGDQILEVVQNITLKVDLAAEAARWNIAPSQEILILADHHGPTLEKARWGLIPHWAKDASIGNRMINARAETLRDKPAFRVALAKRRCAIPADGFYEWRKNADAKKTKTPMYIRLKTHDLFAFAGLWETWRDPDGADVTSCTIITTRSNGLLAPIHDRMPVMLMPENVTRWLAARDEEVDGFLRPFDAAAMEMHAVSNLVNNPRHDARDCAVDVPDPPSAPAEPRTLFD